jgi:hypothetical protein
MELEGILLAELKDGPKYLKRDTLLSNQVGLIPKYVWQTLGVTNLPISSTTNSNLLKVMKSEFDRIRDEEAAQAAKEAKDTTDAKATSPSTAGSPSPTDPAALPTSKVGLDVKPANSGMEVGAMDDNFRVLAPGSWALARRSRLRCPIRKSGMNPTRFAPYVPDPAQSCPEVTDSIGLSIYT